MDWRLSEIFDPIMNIADDVDELSSRFEQLTEAAHLHQTQIEPPNYPPRHSNTSPAYKNLPLSDELSNGHRSYATNNYSPYFDARNSDGAFVMDDSEGLEPLEANHGYYPPHYDEDLDPEDYNVEPSAETWHSSLYEDSKMDSARNSTEEAIFWRNRCAELELALQNFRAQANKVRGMLRDKLGEMEMRVLNAESRADIAEAKAEMMENQLRNMWESESGPGTLSADKDENIGRLEDQIQEQRKLRVKDAQEVEAKAARIKEWVTNKLRELEEQNQLLREQNQKCNEQLNMLRKRLQTISSRHGSDVKEEGTVPQENGHRDGTSQAVWVPHADVNSTSSLLTCNNRNSMPSGLGLSGPVNLLMQQRFPHSTRSSQSGVENRMSRSATTATEFSSLPAHPICPAPHRPKSQLPLERAAYMTHRSCLSADLSGMVYRPVNELLEPRTANDTNREHHDYDIPRAMVKPIIPARLNNEIHDYAEIYTPSNERTNLWPLSTSLIKNGGGATNTSAPAVSSSAEKVGVEQGIASNKPPTPPLHRCPSWESRIYKSAVESFQQTTAVVLEPMALHPNDPGADRSTPSVTLAYVGQQQSRISDFTGYQHLSVPVFASVNGRASQIRSVPFTGDSSDSSDGEDGGSKAENYEDNGTTDDYALPPDAQPLPSEGTSQVDNHVPSHAHSSSRPVERDSVTANIVLEKAGYLTKLGGKLKTWQKRWFVLKNGILSYWKSQVDMGRKPQGQIALNENCQILRAEDTTGTFEISTGKKTYYLNAESATVMEEWIKALEGSVRRRLPCPSSSGLTCVTTAAGRNMEPSVQGWLTKVRHGHVKRCWCALVGRTLYYYKSPGEAVNSQTNMRETRVEEVQHMSDSDCEDHDGALNSCEFTIGIFPMHQDPLYLLLPNKQEKDSWLYHLTVVSGGNGKVGTQYEQLIQKLMEVDGDPACVIWRHPVLLHTKDHISSPLTSLPENLHSEAIKLFKAIQLFTSVLLDSAGIDYHVVLAQNALQQGLTYPDLQTELLAALVKQTTRHVHSKGGVQQLLLSATQSLFTHDSLAPKTSTSSLAGGERGERGGGAGSSSSLGGGYGSSHGTLSNTSTLEHKGQATPFAYIQGWQLLALAVSLFVPKNNKMLWYLRLHLRRNTDPKSEVGKYAAYCQRALGRTLEIGGRTAKPSRMEVLSILLKNPYRHSLPHAIPVHFLNGTYQVVGFDGSTTVEEFLVNLTQEMKCRETRLSGFALYSDDPIEKDVEHWLHPSSKVCDVISKWETALREKGLGKFENTRVIQLTFRNRLYWRTSSKQETERERLLLCYQINRQIMHNQFPANRDLALELAAIMAQVEFGEYSTSDENTMFVNPNMETVLGRFVPPKFKANISAEDQQQVCESLRGKWVALKGRTIMDCTRIYLTCTRKWPFFGAVIFEAQAKGSEMENGVVCVAVWEDGLAVMDSRTLVPSLRIPFASVVTFGGCQDDFMLVVNQPERDTTRKLVFALAKHKVLELTLLIADYMNAWGAQGGGGTPSTTLKKSKAVKERVPSFACHSKADSQKLASEDGNT